MQDTTMNTSWDNYMERVRKDYPDVTNEEFHATEGWYDKMATLLQEKYGITHEEALEMTKSFAEEVSYDENEQVDGKRWFESFRLDTNPDNTGEMTAVV